MKKSQGLVAVGAVVAESAESAVGAVVGVVGVVAVVAVGASFNRVATYFAFPLENVLCQYRIASSARLLGQ